MGRGDTFSFYQYASDNGTNYGIKLSADVAAQGGFTTTVDPASVSIWPFKTKNLRYVRGKSSAGKTTKLPVYNNANSLYTNGGSFTLGGTAYAVEGQIGEKRRYNSVS